MMTYLVLNLAFFAVFGLPFIFLRIKFGRSWLTMLTILIIMTAVFDSLIVGLHIVAYDSNKISGIYLAKVPIEDFFYSIMAAVIVPGLWLIQDKTKK